MVNRKVFFIITFIFFVTMHIFSENKIVIKDDGTTSSNDINDISNASLSVENSELSENSEIPEFSLKETEEGYVFIQRLSWQENEYAKEYNVVVEMYDKQASSWIELNNQTQTETFIEVSLNKGLYRYKVITYNFLAKIEDETEWIDFEVIQAIQPELTSVSPMNIWLEEDQDGIFKITGKDISDETTFELSKTGILQYDIWASPIKVAENGKNAELQFKIEELDTGEYNFVVTNPGGLKSQQGPVKINYKKIMDLDISTGYSPVILAQGESNDYKTVGEYFGSGFWAYAPTARITWIFLKKRNGYYGISFTPSFFRMNYEQTGYSLTSNVWIGNVDFSYQFPIIKKKLVLDTRIGSGIFFFQGMVFDFGNDVKSPELNTWTINVNLGATIQYYFTNRLYMETGCDYTIGFLPNNYSLGLVIPYISVGWQF